MLGTLWKNPHRFPLSWTRISSYGARKVHLKLTLDDVGPFVFYLFTHPRMRERKTNTGKSEKGKKKGGKNILNSSQSAAAVRRRGSRRNWSWVGMMMAWGPSKRCLWWERKGMKPDLLFSNFFLQHKFPSSPAFHLLLPLLSIFYLQPSGSTCIHTEISIRGAPTVHLPFSSLLFSFLQSFNLSFCRHTDRQTDS